VHRHLAAAGRRAFDDDTAGGEELPAEQLRDVADRGSGHPGRVKEGDVVLQSARTDRLAHGVVELLDMPEPLLVVSEPRVGEQVLASDRGQQAFGHRLRGSRDRQPLTVAGAVHVARGRGLGPATGAFRNLTGGDALRGLRAEDREQRLEQRQVDHLPAAVPNVAGAQGGQYGEGAVGARDHIRKRQGRQHGLPVSEAVHGREARHGLHQGAESRLRRT
jgi:hypothetical protein